MIVIIRPFLQALETKNRFMGHGITDLFIFSPVDIIAQQQEINKFIEICYHKQCDSLIFTSQNALSVLSDHIDQNFSSSFPYPVFVVGQKTYEKAKVLGFQNVIQSPTGNADGILRLLQDYKCVRPIFGAGVDKKDTLLKSKTLEDLFICELYKAEASNNMPLIPFEDNLNIDLLCFSSRMFQIAWEEIKKQRHKNCKMTWHIVGDKKLYNPQERFVFYNSPDAIYDAFNIK